MRKLSTKQREALRKQFVNDYTINNIKKLTLNDYVIGHGNGNKSFCYRLENELIELGDIHGSNASKFGVWYGTNGKETKKCNRCTKKLGKNIDSAFETIKAEIIKLIEAGGKDDENTILNSYFAPMVRGKILFVYYPEKYLPIYSEELLKYFLITLDIYDFECNHLSMQKKLLKYRGSNKETKNMDNYEFYDYLYRNYNPKNALKFDDYNEKVTNEILNTTPDNNENTSFVDSPQEKGKSIISYGKKYYPRKLENAREALRLAGYKCEICEGHKTFIKKSDGKPYVEAHHLIPMSCSTDKKYKKSLDAPANIISLCSNCHNQLHYGKDVKGLLEKLFDERKERLANAEINITLKELFNIYEVKDK